MLVHYIKKIKRRKEAQKRNKIIAFSIFSGIVSGITAWFFSNKENRENTVKLGKKLGSQVKEKSLDLKELSQKEMSKLGSYMQNQAGQIKKKADEMKQKATEKTKEKASKIVKIGSEENDY